MIRRDVLDSILDSSVRTTVNKRCTDIFEYTVASDRLESATEDSEVRCKEGARQVKQTVEQWVQRADLDELQRTHIDSAFEYAHEEAGAWCNKHFEDTGLAHCLRGAQEMTRLAWTRAKEDV